MSESKNWPSPGDIVVLKSGGPKMTVSMVSRDDVECVWFDGGELGQETFLKCTLTWAAVILGEEGPELSDPGGETVT